MDDGYQIVRTYKYRDSLDRDTLCIDILRNGMWRVVVVTTDRGGIDRHHVFKITASQVKEMK